MITLSIREQEKMEIEPPLKRFRSGQVPNPRKESKKESESENIHFGIVEWWPQTDCNFIAIVSLHNEILALDEKGIGLELCR